jgi:hypothetical protein
MAPPGAAYVIEAQSEIGGAISIMAPLPDFISTLVHRWAGFTTTGNTGTQKTIEIRQFGE